MRALIVEGDPHSRHALVELLNSFSFEVRAASNIAAARRHLLKWTVELLILDLTLADGDGTLILSQVRRQRHRCIVALISDSHERSLSDALKLRPEALFGKPVDIEDFREWLIGLSDSETPTSQVEACPTVAKEPSVNARRPLVSGPA